VLLFCLIGQKSGIRQQCFDDLNLISRLDPLVVCWAACSSVLGDLDSSDLQYPCYGVVSDPTTLDHFRQKMTVIRRAGPTTHFPFVAVLLRIKTLSLSEGKLRSGPPRFSVFCLLFGLHLFIGLQQFHKQEKLEIYTQIKKVSQKNNAMA